MAKQKGRAYFKNAQVVVDKFGYQVLDRNETHLFFHFISARYLTILFISRDLAVVESIADRIAVMHAGKIVEHAGTDYLIKYLHHPYTKSLLQSVLDVDPTTRRPVTRRISTPAESTVK